MGHTKYYTLILLLLPKVIHWSHQLSGWLIKLMKKITGKSQVTQKPWLFLGGLSNQGLSMPFVLLFYFYDKLPRKHKRKYLIGLMVPEGHRHDGRAKARWKGQLRAHISNCKQKEERASWKWHQPLDLPKPVILFPQQVTPDYPSQIIVLTRDQVTDVCEWDSFWFKSPHHP